ncbi:unnamed protein product [Prunus armeniaca]|nr:hypothetical protein GBA52_008323 [Prunus armeniaca]
MRPTTCQCRSQGQIHSGAKGSLGPLAVRNPHDSCGSRLPGALGSRAGMPIRRLSKCLEPWVAGQECPPVLCQNASMKAVLCQAAGRSCSRQQFGSIILAKDT